MSDVPPPTSSLCWTVPPLSCSNHPISWLFGLHSIWAGWISITFPQVCHKQCKRRPFGHIYFPCGNLFCNTNSQNKGMEMGGKSLQSCALNSSGFNSSPHLGPATLHCQWLFCLWLLEAASCVSVGTRREDVPVINDKHGLSRTWDLTHFHETATPIFLFYWLMIVLTDLGLWTKQ